MHEKDDASESEELQSVQQMQSHAGGRSAFHVTLDSASSEKFEKLELLRKIDAASSKKDTFKKPSL